MSCKVEFIHSLIKLLVCIIYVPFCRPVHLDCCLITIALFITLYKHVYLESSHLSNAFTYYSDSPGLGLSALYKGTIVRAHNSLTGIKQATL